jgi:cell division protein FtsL
MAGGAFVFMLLYVDIIAAASSVVLVQYYVDLISKRFRILCEDPLDR